MLEVTQDITDKVMTDPMYAAQVVARIENRRRDVDPRPIVPLVFNPGQEYYYSQYLRALDCQRKLNRPGFEGLFGKPRQIGVSTLINWLGFHQAIQEEAVRITVLAHERDAVQNILSSVKRFYRYWPEEFSFLFREEESPDFKTRLSRSAIELPNGSRYVVHTANSEDAARSFACDFLHLSEYAHYANESAIGAAMAMIPNHAYVFKESTARGQAGAFYEEWKKALYVHEVESIIASGDLSSLAAWSGAYKFFFPWFKDPQNSRDVQSDIKEEILKTLDDVETELLELYPEITIENLVWRRWKIAQLRHDELDPIAFFKQEYPSNDIEMFQATGSRVFNAPILNKMLERNKEVKPILVNLTHNITPTTTTFLSAQLYIYSPPEEDHQYTIGVDVSQGLKTSDDTVITVLDRLDGTTTRLVAIWKGKIGAQEAGDIATLLAEFYNNAFIVPEVNNMGISTCRQIVANRYPFVYHREQLDVLSMESSHGAFRFGFFTGSSKSQGKKTIINQLSAAILEETIDIPDKRVITELLEFENVDGALQAPAGKNDDTVISLALALYGHLIAAPPVKPKKVQPKPTLSTHDQNVWKSVKKSVKKWEKQNAKELKRQEAEFHYFANRAKNQE